MYQMFNNFISLNFFFHGDSKLRRENLSISPIH